jgi:hypothetical protein
MKKRLPDFWWILSLKKQPHAYVCPLLMTISSWLYRLRGKPAYWEASTPARIYHGHMEISCLFPRWLVSAECNFWNGRIGLRIRS